MNNSPLYNVDKRPTWGNDHVDIRPGIGMSARAYVADKQYCTLGWSDF